MKLECIRKFQAPWDGRGSPVEEKIGRSVRSLATVGVADFPIFHERPRLTGLLPMRSRPNLFAPVIKQYELGSSKVDYSLLDSEAG